MTIDTLRDLQAKSLGAGISLTEAQTSATQAQTGLTQAQTVTEGARKRNLDSQTSLNRHQIRKVLTEVRKLGVDIKDAEYDLLLRELEVQPVNSVAGLVDRLGRALDREITPGIRKRIEEFWNREIK